MFGFIGRSGKRKPNQVILCDEDEIQAELVDSWSKGKDSRPPSPLFYKGERYTCARLKRGQWIYRKHHVL